VFWHSRRSQEQQKSEGPVGVGGETGGCVGLATGGLTVGVLVGGEAVGAEETHTPLQPPSHWLAFALHQSL